MGTDGELYENACRLCDKNAGPMHSVFEKNASGQQILHLIKDLLPILIYRTDPLPKHVCENCYANLNNFYDFRRNSLATLDSQKGRLRSSYSENNISVRLYLDTLENENCQLNDQPFSIVQSNKLNSESDKPEQINSSNYESELCAELQRTIQESLKQNKLKEKIMQQKEFNFDFLNAETEDKNTHQNSATLNGTTVIVDDDSEQSFINPVRSTDSPYAMYQSDMELCDSDNEMGPKIITTNIFGKRLFADKQMLPSPKKRRLIGPKSRMQLLQIRYENVLREEFHKKEEITYNPLTLLQCVLNTFNKLHVPEYVCENYKKCVALVDIDNSSNDANTLRLRYHNDLLQPYPENSDCTYCETPFPNVNLLAEHECRHMFVVLGDKVDTPGFWPNFRDDYVERNKWLKTLTQGVDDEVIFTTEFESKKMETSGDFSRISIMSQDLEEIIVDDQSLLVPMSQLANDSNKLKGEVVLIDTKATVNGILLSELPKDERRTLYKSVTVSGIKRKFCPLCRYTFKDNWAIESHYFSTACHYTCRFCGVRFNKQRHEFDPHVKQHILMGDTHTSKIFSSRKFKLTPKVISEDKMRARPPPMMRTPMPRIKPLKMKNLLQRNIMEPRFTIKSEPTEDGSQPEMRTESKPQNQAYFCRKCYQVFFKLDEFNIHVVSCKGTGANTIKSSNARTYSRTPIHSSPNSFSRPPMNQRPTSSSGSANSDNEISPSGRPMRHCVKEVGTYIDREEPEETEETAMRKVSGLPSQRGFECNMCSSCFPTVHSRNSHMRIHKAAMQLSSLSQKSISISRGKPNNYINKKVVEMVDRQGIPTFAKYVNEVKIKQEPMEPIVEIHEHSDFSSIPSNIGSVSITPIPNPMQKTNLDPNIMRLVQNNPNLTIKTMGNMSERSGTSTPTANNYQMNVQETDSSKCYRCSSCSKPFANKSNLYFHKKNQCSGSRFPCPFCKKRFGTEAAYSSHIFYNHPE